MNFIIRIMSDKTVQSKFYRPEIDGLRAIAIIAVIINHFDHELLRSGHLGVDIFFVISGFVITQSLSSRHYLSFWKFIVEFYTRRIKRLAPALIFFVAFTSFLSLIFIDPITILSAFSLRTGIAALFGVSNLYLFKNATDYFGSSAELNPFTHTWSLGVEEQFYLLFPLIIWFSGYFRKHAKGTLAFVSILSIGGFLSLLSSLWLMKANPTFGFYLMPTRFWELAIGSLAFLLVRQRVTGSNQFERHIFSTPILLLIVAALFLPQTLSHISSLMVVFFTALLMVMIRPGCFTYKLLTLRPVLFLGVISYSLYLWHWSIITICRWTIGIHWWTVPFQLATILALAVFSYFCIEQPFRKYDWPVLKKGPFTIGPIGYAFLTLTLCSVTIFLGGNSLKDHLYTGRKPVLIKKGVASLQDWDTYQEKYTWKGTECVLTSNDDVGKKIAVNDCTFGDFDMMERRFLVIGNSFTTAELDMFKILVDEGIGSVTITSAWAACAVPEIPNNGPWGKANDYYWETIVPDLIDMLQAGDFIIMINDGAVFSPKNEDNVSSDRLKKLRQGLSRMAEELSRRGISIIYQSGNPFVRDSKCTPDTAIHQWWNFNSEPCVYYTKQDSLDRRQDYHGLLTDLQDTHSNFFILDLFEVFCPGSVCKLYNEEGTFLYRDEWSHPSVEANILAQPVLLETVMGIIGQLDSTTDISLSY